jgi:hypothetical protein
MQMIIFYWMKMNSRKKMETIKCYNSYLSNTSTEIEERGITC